MSPLYPPALQPDYPWLSEGLLGWSFDETLAASSGVLPSAGIMNLTKIMVPSSISVTNIVQRIETAGSTLTASQCFSNIYTLTGATLTLLASTADQSGVWNSTGTKIMPLASGPFSITGGAGVFVYVGFYSNGTTQPAFARAGGNDPNGGQAAGTTQRACRITGTSTTTPPASVTISAMVGAFHFWAGLS